MANGCQCGRSKLPGERGAHSNALAAERRSAQRVCLACALCARGREQQVQALLALLSADSRFPQEKVEDVALRGLLFCRMRPRAGMRLGSVQTGVLGPRSGP